MSKTSPASRANLLDFLPDKKISWFKSATSKLPAKTATLAETFERFTHHTLRLLRYF
jgi:hypothetical protein